MVRATLTTPLYISSIWVLLITYQMFTSVAVISIVQSIGPFFPSIQELLTPRVMDRIGFLYAFAWIWVMTSLIPSIILKKKSASLQFVVVMILSFLAVESENILSFAFGEEFVQQIFGAAVWLRNPLLAALYLLAPFLVILSVDLYERKKRKLEEKSQLSSKTSGSK